MVKCKCAINAPKVKNNEVLEQSILGPDFKFGDVRDGERFSGSLSAFWPKNVPRASSSRKMCEKLSRTEK